MIDTLNNLVQNNKMFEILIYNNRSDLVVHIIIKAETFRIAHLNYQSHRQLHLQQLAFFN